MFDSEVSEGPDITTFDQSEEVETAHRLAIPVQIRKEQETLGINLRQCAC